MIWKKPANIIAWRLAGWNGGKAVFRRPKVTWGRKTINVHTTWATALRRSILLRKRSCRKLRCRSNMLRQRSLRSKVINRFTKVIVFGIIIIIYESYYRSTIREVYRTNQSCSRSGADSLLSLFWLSNHVRELKITWRHFSYTINQSFSNIFFSFSSVKWERDGNPVEWDSSIDGALKVSRVEPSYAGAYTCAVMGPHGEIARRELQLVVSSELFLFKYFSTYF